MAASVETKQAGSAGQRPSGFESLSLDGAADVFLFSGQGSQKPGMGSDLFGRYDVADTFSCASDLFGFDVAQMVRSGPADQLNETYHAQAAILTLSIALASVIGQQGIRPGAVLGFSLGQITALYAAGMLDKEQCFALARFRAECMSCAAEENPGAMCALLGADEASVRDVCDECAQADVLVPANYNAPGQIVVSGSVGAVGRVESAWAAQKRKSVRLATSGAFHSPLMADAAQAFAGYLEDVEFAEPETPLICNTDARPLDAGSIRGRLSMHLVEPVRFEQSIVNLRACGAERFVEIGFGGVLVGLVKRIDRNAVRIKVEDAPTLADYIQNNKEAGR